MGTSRKITERQASDAKAALDERNRVLQREGLDAEKFALDPIWRKLDARSRQINSRLRQIGRIETQDAELQKMKSEKAARMVAEKTAKPEKKSASEGKPAKEKPAKAPKAKAEKAEKKV